MGTKGRINGFGPPWTPQKPPKMADFDPHFDRDRLGTRFFAKICCF